MGLLAPKAASSHPQLANVLTSLSTTSLAEEASTQTWILVLATRVHSLTTGAAKLVLPKVMLAAATTLRTYVISLSGACLVKDGTLKLASVISGLFVIKLVIRAKDKTK